MKIIQLTADYYEETALIAIIKRRRTPSTRSYPLLRVFWKKLNQARAAELQSVCRYLRSASPSLPAQSRHLPRSSSAAFCRVLTSGWEEGKGAAEREKERKKNRIDINMPRRRCDRCSKRIPDDGTFSFINGRSMSRSYDGKASSPHPPMGAGRLPLYRCVIDPLRF